MDLVVGDALTDRLCDSPDSHIIYDVKLFDQLVFGQVAEVIGHQGIYVLFQGTDGFHQRALEVVADTHNLTGCLHLCGQGTFCTDKLIERQTRDFYNTVIQHRLEACVGFSGNGVRDLIQSVAKCDLCSNLCNRITGRFGSQCGRTADTRIYLDNTVLEAVRIQRILYVASAGDTELGDDVECGSTQHLILFISQGLGRCYDNTVSGVNADRVDVLHVADGDAVSYAVPHYLVLDLFPSGDTSFNEYFADTGKTESVREDLDQLFFVVSDTAAASAEGVSRTQYNRITDLVGEIDTSLYIMDNQGCRYRLADFFHGIFEFLTVLCFFDGLCCGTDQAYVVFF